MIEKAKLQDKLVIMSAEMSQSSLLSGKPIKAEISMVSNAVIDGADYLMLPCDASTRENAVEAIRALRKCCIEAEKLV